MGILAEMGGRRERLFPENKIVLLDGRTLDCFPLGEGGQETVTDDSMRLDTTGEFLTVGGKHPKLAPPTPKAVEAQRDLFLNNAFFLLAHKEQIMSDSRMFLCEVDVRNGLAYTGTSGFSRPTLGIYIEWWLNCPGAMQTDKEGNRLLVCQLAGSPLSGANHCLAICENGERRDVTLQKFSDCWKPFMEINRRYTEAKGRYECYTLQQVIELLDGMDTARAIEAEFLKHEVMALTKEVDSMKKACDYWRNRYQEIVTRYHGKRMLAFYAEYKVFEQEVNGEKEQLKEQKKVLKAQLKNGQLDSKSYQQRLSPMNKRMNALDMKLSVFRNGRVNEVFPEGDVSFSMIEEYACSNSDNDRENNEKINGNEHEENGN